MVIQGDDTAQIWVFSRHSTRLRGTVNVVQGVRCPCHSSPQSSRLGERQGALSRETCSLMVRPRDTEEHVLDSTTLLGMMRNRSIDKARLAGATTAKRSRCRGQAGAPGLPSEPAFSGRRAGSGPVTVTVTPTKRSLRSRPLSLAAANGSSTTPAATLMTLTRRSWTDSLSDTGCLLTRAKPTGYVGRPGVTSSSYHFPSLIPAVLLPSATRWFTSILLFCLQKKKGTAVVY
jgi:hypothetical protein